MESRPTVQSKLYIGIDIHKRSWKIRCATDLSWGRPFTIGPKPSFFLNISRTKLVFNGLFFDIHLSSIEIIRHKVNC